MVLASTVLSVGCGDDLSRGELAEYSALTERLRLLCEREAPLQRRERSTAKHMVKRMMDLTKQAPDQNWVVDPDDHDTGTTTPVLHLVYISELLSTAPEGRRSPCYPSMTPEVDDLVAELF